MTGQQIADILLIVFAPALGIALGKERANNASIPLLFIEPDEDGTPEHVLFGILCSIRGEQYREVRGDADTSDEHLEQLAQEGIAALRAAGYPY